MHGHRPPPACCPASPPPPGVANGCRSVTVSTTSLLFPLPLSLGPTLAGCRGSSHFTPNLSPAQGGRELGGGRAGAGRWARPGTAERDERKARDAWARPTAPAPLTQPQMVERDGWRVGKWGSPQQSPRSPGGEGGLAQRAQQRLPAGRQEAGNASPHCQAELPYGRVAHTVSRHKDRKRGGLRVLAPRPGEPRRPAAAHHGAEVKGLRGLQANPAKFFHRLRKAGKGGAGMGKAPTLLHRHAGNATWGGVRNAPPHVLEKKTKGTRAEEGSPPPRSWPQLLSAFMCR